MAFAATTVSSSAVGLDVNLAVLNGVVTSDLPVGFVSGTAAPAYNVNNTLATLNVTTGLGLGTLVTTSNAAAGTNAIVDSASSTYPALLSGTATSTVNGIVSNLGLTALNLLHFTATTLSSTTTASEPGGTVNLVGTSVINNLVFYDGLDGIGGTTVTVNATGAASTAINTLILSAAGINVYTNYQTPIVTGGMTTGLNTAALAINLNNFVYGASLLNGTIRVADSQASIGTTAAAVPEPGTWAMMLCGFGLVGALYRRRQYPVLA